MARDVTRVRVEGLKQLDRALGQLPEVVAGNVLRGIAFDALRPMQTKARSFVPVDTGALRDSIIVSEERSRGAIKQLIRTLGKQTFVQVSMGTTTYANGKFYSVFVEFGTSDTPAQPYMRPAWDAEAVPTLRFVEKELSVRIQKAARRHGGA